MKRPAFTLLILAMVICIQAAGCYNPSFDGPGGFICERDGKCPGGYECCSMTGDDVCKPVGQCGKATDLGPSKDVKQDKNQISNDGKPDKTQISSDSNPDKTASPEQMVGIDKGLTNTCNYNEIVTSKYNANVQHFAMALDPNGQPQVFFIEANSNKIMHATRGSKWTIKPGPADPASRLAASLDSNGVIHLAARNEPAVANSPRYLRHYFKVSSSSGWKYKKVDIVETGDSVDIASSGTLTYIAATQNSVGNKSWKVYKVLGSGSAFSTMTWYNYGSGINLFDGRVAVGAAKVASVAVGGGNWNIWTGTHKSPVSQKSTTIKRGSSEFQMGIAIDAAGTTWLAYAPDSSAFMGPLKVSIWKAIGPSRAGSSAAVYLARPRSPWLP